MQWALHVTSDREIKNLGQNGAGLGALRPVHDDPVQDESRRTVEALFGRVPFTRIYFGNEFCEHLIPSAAQLTAVCRAAAESGRALTLLTPYVTDAGLDRLRPLFALLAARRDTTEVVVNDWGVLRLVRREYPDLAPVLGRLLNKTLRDPLAAFYYSRHPLLPKPALAALTQSNLTVPVYRQSLERYGVRMVETDGLVQGLGMDFGRQAPAGAMYVPYGFVASGRICLFASLRQPKEKKFVVAPTCAKACQRHHAECSLADGSCDGKPFTLLHKGNTVFYSRAGDGLRAALREAEARGIERIVYQPQLPM